MEHPIIKIQCRFCNAILNVKNCDGIDDKFVTCPMCKQRSRFRLYKRLNPYLENTNVSTIESIMYRFNLPGKDTCNANSTRQSDQYCIESPCSICVITLREDDIFYLKVNEEEINSVKNIKFDTNQIENIRHRISKLENEWNQHETYYSCPMCGNIMIVTSWPREFSDDYFCECPCCNSRFYFGGTRFAENEAIRINEISANPLILARKVYSNKINMIVKLLNSEVLLIDNYRLIIKAFNNGFKVTHILKLNLS